MYQVCKGGKTTMKAAQIPKRCLFVFCLQSFKKKKRGDTEHEGIFCVSLSISLTPSVQSACTLYGEPNEDLNTVFSVQCAVSLYTSIYNTVTPDFSSVRTFSSISATFIL